MVMSVDYKTIYYSAATGTNALRYISLSSQAKELAKKYTGIQDEDSAVRKFKEVLKSRDRFFNDDKFPTNESGEEAFLKCADTQGAQAFCPVRWKALQKWINSTKHVSGNFVLVTFLERWDVTWQGGVNKTQFEAYKLHKWVAGNFKNAGGNPTIDYHPIRERGGE